MAKIVKPKFEVKVPSSHEMFYIDTKGGKISVMSTFGKPGQEVKLESDCFNHPAWNKGEGSNVNANVGQVVKFKAKFGNVDISKLLDTKK